VAVGGAFILGSAVNLPSFLARLAGMLESPDQWNSDPLRIVPAPKSQEWRVKRETRLWGPVKRSNAGVKLRPLAHVSLTDQVAATAVMLCLANRVESLQGDPRQSISSAEARRRLVSYGNRLFCDNIGGDLHHRWGSEKLYRAYYQDYQNFLSRSEIAAEAIATSGKSQVVMVHADLGQFYDRVRPGLLAQKIDAIAQPIDDPLFYGFTRRLLNWEWDRRDSGEVAKYAEQVGLSDFQPLHFHRA